MFHLMTCAPGPPQTCIIGTQDPRLRRRCPDDLGKKAKNGVAQAGTLNDNEKRVSSRLTAAPYTAPHWPREADVFEVSPPAAVHPLETGKFGAARLRQESKWKDVRWCCWGAAMPGCVCASTPHDEATLLSRCRIIRQK